MLVSCCSQQRQWNQLGLIIAVTSLECRALLKKLFMWGFITAHMNFLHSTLRSHSCLRLGFPIRRFWDKASRANSSFAMCVRVCVCVCVCVCDTCDPVTSRTAVCQAPLSMGFSRQKYWSGLPFPSPGDLPDPGIQLSCIAGRFVTVNHRQEISKRK